MRTELFSLRRSPEEVAELNRCTNNAFRRLDDEEKVHVISKTEVDRNPKKLAEAFSVSIENDDTLDGYIFANAVDTRDSTSFIELFTPLMRLLEEAMDCSRVYTQDGKKLINHINVYSFSCKGTDISGYCFYAIDKYFIVLPAFEKAADISFEDFLAHGVASAKRKLREKLSQYPRGTATFENGSLTYFKSKGRVKSFFFSFIPVKGDKASEVIRKLIVLLAIGAFIAGGVILLNFYVFMPWENNSVMSEIQNIFYATVDEPIYATNDEGKLVQINTSNKNWAGIKKINDEIVAWIKIDGTKIDYPVLEHKGDDSESQFYLYRNYKKEYSDFGSIFVDYRCIDSVNSKNLILHGHNMGSDDSMFGQLMNYSRSDGGVQGNVKYYKEHPIVTVDTPKASEDYIVFATMKIDVSNDLDNVFDYLKADFDSDARFMNFVYNIKLRSYLDVQVPINENDSLLTLSTCSYESDNMRTVVVARKVRENEDVSGYIKTVEKASPINTASSSFSVEYAEGNTPWYDGKGKLEGDETVEYMTQSKMYTVKFLGSDGKPVSTQLVLEGRDAKAPKEKPRKAADGKYYYVFKGWDSVYTDVTENLTVKPIFEKKRIPVETKPTTQPTEAETEPPYIPPETEAPVYTEALPTQPPTEAPPVTKPPKTQPPATTEAEITEAPVAETTVLEEETGTELQSIL